MLADIPDLDLVDPSAICQTAAKERVEALLIDSDALDSLALVQIAALSQQLDIGVTATHSVADANAALARRGFDVIILDFWLGQETTVAFIHDMDAAGIPCIVLTDLNEPDIRRIAFRAGAQAFLSKQALCPQALESVTLAVLRQQLNARAA
jgi:DNA-binding NtrC family response regulator